MKQNLKKDYIWHTIGAMSFLFTNLILTIIVTRINGIYDAGLYTFTMGVTGIIGAVALYGGRNYQVTDTSEEFKSREYVLLRLVMSALATTIAILFVVINQYDIGKSMLILSIMSYQIIWAISESLYGVLQKHNKLYIAGYSMLTRTLASIALFTIINLITHSILFASLGFIMVHF